MCNICNAAQSCLGFTIQTSPTVCDKTVFLFAQRNYVNDRLRHVGFLTNYVKRQRSFMYTFKGQFYINKKKKNIFIKESNFIYCRTSIDMDK